MLSDASVIYVVELGASHCSAGFHIDGITTQLTQQRTPQVREGGADALFEVLCHLVDEVAKSAPPMDAVAVSFSGFLDLRERVGIRDCGPFRDHEVMVSAPHINDIRNLPFFEWIERAGWGVPVHIENDANAALRSVTEIPTAVSVNLGTGIGGAIKRDNRIVHTPNTWSNHQIGHGFSWSPPEGLMRKCLCGSIGCLEAAVGAWGLSERYGVRPEDAPPDVYDQMRQEVIEYLSPAIAHMVERARINRVLLSGGAAQGFQGREAELDGFDFAGAVARRILRESPGLTAVTVQVLNGVDSGLHGVALAAQDYDFVSASLTKH